MNDMITDNSVDYSVSQGVDIPPTDYLDAMQAYNLHAGVDRLLDVMRELNLNGNYYTSLVPFPPSNNINIPALAEFVGYLNVPAGSILVGLTGGSEPTDGSNGVNNFSLRIYDKATGTDLYNNQYATGGAILAPPMSALVNGASSGRNTPIAPFYLPDPYIVDDPGSLQISLTNLYSGSSVIAQVLFIFAVPIDADNSNNQIGE